MARPMQRMGEVKRSDAELAPAGMAAVDTTSRDRVPLPNTAFD